MSARLVVFAVAVALRLVSTAVEFAANDARILFNGLI